MTGAVDFLGNLRKMASAVQVQKPRRDFEQFVTMMANRGYMFTEETLAIAKKYCSGIGLCLKGDVGTGKSFFFYCAQIPALSLELAQGKTVEKITWALDSWQNTDILIDDIGKENVDYKSYGTSVALLDYILEKRLDSCAMTHMTTNKSPQELLDRYGARTVDRLTQLCEVVELNGSSRRNPDSQRMNSWYAEFFRGRIWEWCSAHCRFYDDDEHRCIKGKEIEPRLNSEHEAVCPYF